MSLRCTSKREGKIIVLVKFDSICPSSYNYEKMLIYEAGCLKDENNNNGHKMMKLPFDRMS